MATKDDLDLLLRTIGDCKIQQVIGQIRWGNIYKIVHSRLGVCILKHFEGRIAENEKLMKQLKREMQVFKEVQHPYIGKVYEMSSQPFPYILREFIVGTSLRRRLRKGALSTLEATKVLIKVALGMQASYNFGLNHRNLKPSNIYLTPDRQMKIVDFCTPAFVPYYFSPEHCIGTPCDCRSDIYSLGVIYYHVLTGEVPFQGASAEMKQMHISDQYPTIPDLPEAIKTILDKSLAKKTGTSLPKFYGVYL